jgi:hypothetical protein
MYSAVHIIYYYFYYYYYILLLYYFIPLPFKYLNKSIIRVDY